MTHETKATHTPGPWTVSHPAISFQITAGKVHVADAFAKVSAGISDKYILESEAEANARLIAAAPDLLHALTNAMNALKCSKDQTVLNTSAVRSAEAVIRKATERE